MQGKDPVGGQWNYDSDNRGSFGKKGPGELPGYTSFSPDEVTAEVLAAVERRFGDHPGSLENFDWPVTRPEALVALEDFVENRLENFGDYQDAMWTEEPYLYH